LIHIINYYHNNHTLLYTQLLPPTGNTTDPPVDYTKRDYADIDFASTQKLEKSILKQDGPTSSVVELQSKGAKRLGSNKNNEMTEDQSGYITVCDVHWLLLYVDRYICSLI